MSECFISKKQNAIEKRDNREEKGIKECEQNSTNFYENMMRDSMRIVPVTVSFSCFIAFAFVHANTYVLFKII